MLRKITHIILAFFLTVATTGITLSMHYCGGELVSASINKEAKTCCDGTGGCCDNRTFHFEIRDDYVNRVQFNSAETPELEVLFPVLFVLPLELINEEDRYSYSLCDSSSPPVLPTRLAFLQTYLC